MAEPLEALRAEVSNRRSQQRTMDLLGFDHYPCCPHCGNVCAQQARVCFQCGTHLYEDVTNAGRRRKAREAPMIIDLDVTQIAERIYELRRDVEHEPPADDVSRLDWQAARVAALELYYLISEKARA